MKERIATLEGSVSIIQQTLNSLITKIEDIEGNVSNVTHLATSLQAEVDDLKTKLEEK